MVHEKKFTLDTKQDNLKKDYQIVKENILNEAKLDPKMKLLEYRLILIAMSKISPLAEELGYINFTAREFCNLLELRKDGMYSYIKKASQNLATRTLTIDDKKNKKGVTFPWLAQIKYDESLISIRFNNLLEKHILKIRKENGYTKYFIKNILYLKSKYSIRIYELLKQCEKMKKRTFDLLDFREKIGATKKSHEKMNMFKKDILLKAIEEINVCTDILVNFEEIKEGRKVSGLTFFIQSKSELSKNGNLPTITKDKIILRIQHLIHSKTGYIFEAKHMNNIHRNILIDLLKNFDLDKYSKVLIHSPEGFFINELKILQEFYPEKILKRFDDY